METSTGQFSRLYNSDSKKHWDPEQYQCTGTVLKIKMYPCCYYHLLLKSDSHSKCFYLQTVLSLSNSVHNSQNLLFTAVTVSHTASFSCQLHYPTTLPVYVCCISLQLTNSPPADLLCVMHEGKNRMWLLFIVTSLHHFGF